jgi:glycosyltransferase involved in cell wall biosynthesis
MALEWISLVIIIFAFMRLAVVLLNFFSKPYLNDQPLSSEPLVSILIPARNEAQNLPVLLEALFHQTYAHIEIIVYDDQSEDDTPVLVETFAAKDGRFRGIRGFLLPEGWTGKNYACHMLGKEARGSILLFLDADVIITNNAVRKATAYFLNHRLDMLSLFPRQIMHTAGEKMVVPLMNWILLSLLPLPLVRKSPKSSLAAANGQFMMFDARNYQQHSWHEQVRNTLVEDIVINRRMKKKGYETATLLGKDDVMCRMYGSYKEGVNGFAKNVLQFFGGSVPAVVLFIMFTFPGIVIIPMAFGMLWLGLYIFVIFLIRIFAARVSKQSVSNNLILHIPQMITFVYIVSKGIRVVLTGKYQWKGRMTGGAS